MSTPFLAVNKGSHQIEGRFYATDAFHARRVAKAIFPTCYVKTEQQLAASRKPCGLCECRPCMCNKPRRTKT